MTSVDVTAILAAYLVDPAFTAAFDANPRNAVLSAGGSAALAREVSAIDLERLQSFRGLITKVQHNFLWAAFPLTLTHLRNTRLDLPLFSALAPTHLDLRQRGVRDVGERIATFVGFAADFLRRAGGPGALECRLLLTHENCLREVNDPTLSGVAECDAPGDSIHPHHLTGRSVPVLLGRLLIRKFTASPLPLARAIASAKPAPRVRRRTTDIAYWKGIGAQGARVFAVTDLTPRLLAAIDGRRTVGNVVRRVTGLRAPDPFLPAFVKAAQIGLITFRTPRRRAVS